MPIENISYDDFRKLKGDNKPDHVTIGKNSRTFKYHLKDYVLYDENVYDGNTRSYSVKYNQ